jgi:hypothetical protein
MVLENEPTAVAKRDRLHTFEPAQRIMFSAVSELTQRSRGTDSGVSGVDLQRGETTIFQDSSRRDLLLDGKPRYRFWTFPQIE